MRADGDARRGGGERAAEVDGSLLVGSAPVEGVIPKTVLPVGILFCERGESKRCDPDYCCERDTASPRPSTFTFQRESLSKRCKGGSESSDTEQPVHARELLPFFSMNGDMPHVPITTLAGIASLTDPLDLCR
ncbi:hypothetical protein DNTS_011605 [Danionella cerebrum]|uniref:Uncharacterized protein n=1 Tax=Danionella cerebrum TaxID=2873325 RepID=A0A553RDM0_9TELE|nr:hypothetical protein DNTS_011605 [Danionella translucida]